MYCIHTVTFLLLAIAITKTLGFLPAMHGWGHRSLSAASLQRVSPMRVSKPDLFSDDIFGDGNDNSKKKEVQPIKSKSKYLDQDWELSPEDQMEYKGFPSKQDATEHANEEPEIAFPCFALMYRLRKEFVDTKIDSVLADHNRYCTRFKRLINSEAISMKQRKGFVLLWAGLTAVDKAETRAEIMQFLEEDPLIEKDMIEKWDIIDLESKVDGVKASAGKAPPTASSRAAV